MEHGQIEFHVHQVEYLTLKSASSEVLPCTLAGSWQPPDATLLVASKRGPVAQMDRAAVS